jgi:peptidoglycan/LPS O-acetylase OafA/YrhL
VVITLASLAATLALAAVSWYFVEEPALRLKNRLQAVGIGTYIPQ